ncbi:MAG TPA: DNA polymerase III subunit gamma/tau [Gemmatimonadaceae bacterium]|nr:DNA polymerase III subunit gamma/tau [Gemmatimonadaceae bacterium]
MAYLSLARKYRPKRFADVAVQQHVANTLKGAIARDRVAHAYLLCGPRGVGKTTLARVLAMALNCENRAADGEPCGECTNCQRIWSGSTSLDVVEIDAASNRGVDDARDLRERASYAAGQAGGYRVYIVDEAHMLTREAWNTLLKILEEPPPHVVFVFATTEPQKIAQTASPVLSRMQRFDFKRIGPAEVRERLTTVLAAEKVRTEPEALTMLARAADGSMRDALSLADQALSLGDGTLGAARVREALGLVAEDEYIAMLDIILQRRAKDVFPAVARLVDEGVDLPSFLAGFADVLRALLAVQLGGEASDFSEQARAAITARKDALGQGDVLRMLTAITELEPRFRRSGQQQILLETALVRFALLDHSVSIEEVLTALGGTPGGSGGSVARDVARQAPKPAAPVQRAAPPASVSPPAPVPTPAPAVAERRAPSGPLSVPALVAAWETIIQRLAGDGRSLFGAALKHAVPVVVTAKGEITLELEPEASIYEQPITSSAAQLLEAVRAQFPEATKVSVRVATAGTADAGPPKRITAEHVKAERLASLRKKDPALDAAVDSLDLELLD